MEIMSYIVPIAALSIFILTVIIMFRPKVRGNMMSRQVKSMKYMMDESKDDIQNISTNMTDATKSGIEISARALRKGLIEEEVIYCKYCGTKIDKDSRFYKNCGKRAII